MVQIAVTEDRMDRAFVLIARFTTKPVVTTLDVKATPTRLSGNTTRQVDYAIDHLFKGYAVICFDHDGEGKNPVTNRALFDRVVRRLEREHPGITGEDYIGMNQLYGFLYLKT